jgi:hypothetical protein
MAVLLLLAELLLLGVGNFDATHGDAKNSADGQPTDGHGHFIVARMAEKPAESMWSIVGFGVRGWRRYEVAEVYASGGCGGGVDHGTDGVVLGGGPGQREVRDLGLGARD